MIDPELDWAFKLYDLASTALLVAQRAASGCDVGMSVQSEVLPLVTRCLTQLLQNVCTYFGK